MNPETSLEDDVTHEISPLIYYDIHRRLTFNITRPRFLHCNVLTYD